jgi:hypothetical protein
MPKQTRHSKCPRKAHRRESKCQCKTITNTVTTLLITFQQVSFTSPPVASVPFISTTMTVTTHENDITVSVKGFTFPLGVQGYIFTEAGFIPQNLAPTSALAVVFEPTSGVEGRVFRDGSIRFSAPEENPLGAGTYTIPDFTVTYHRYKLAVKCIDNFRIASGFTNATVNAANVAGADVIDNYEYTGLAFFNGILYATWPDNSPQVLAQNPNADDAQTQWTFNKLSGTKKLLPVDQNLSTPAGPIPPGGSGLYLFAEGQITVNPRNPNQLATVVQGQFYPHILYMVTSEDNGVTWKVVKPFDNGAPLRSDCAGCTSPFQNGINVAADPHLIYDKFGNLFFTYLAGCAGFTCPPNHQGTTLAIAVSTDNGQSWSTVAFDPPIPGGRPEFGLDYDTIATGNDIDGISSVLYVGVKPVPTFTELEGEGFTRPYVVYAFRFTGPGIANYTGMHSQEIPGSERFGYGELSVADSGRVALTAIATNTFPGTIPPVTPNFGALVQGQGIILLSQNTGGFLGAFTPFQKIADTTIGYNATPPPQAGRGTWAHPEPVFDGLGRLYIVYVDQPASPNLANPAEDIWLIFSDDNGDTWSPPFKVNNDPPENARTHFMPQIRRDPTSNKIAITWLDTRNSPDPIQEQLFGAYISPKFAR